MSEEIGHRRKNSALRKRSIVEARLREDLVAC